MIVRYSLFIGALTLLTACGIPEDGHSGEIGRAHAALQTVTYVGKESITDFTGYGQHLQYWPLFGLTSPQTARRTDDDACIEITPDFSDFRHHYLFDGRTFSNDALGSPIGTKTRGGYPDWPIFTLPDGTTGRSGTFYDESNIDNSNNTVNQIRINVPTLHEFCLNLITDNTNGQHNADVRFEARSDDVNVDLGGHPDLTFDGVTDMYTFRYTGMEEDDVFKVRLQCSSASGCQGAGLGGIMVSHISTCTGSGMVDAGTVDGGTGADAGTTASDSGTVTPVDSGAGATDSGSVTTGDSGSTTPPPPRGGTEGGCSCQAGDARGSGAGLLLLGLVYFYSVTRRRRFSE